MSKETTHKPPFGSGPLAWWLFWRLFMPIYACLWLVLLFFCIRGGHSR